jgi:hypothetical protein
VHGNKRPGSEAKPGLLVGSQFYVRGVSCLAHPDGGLLGELLAWEVKEELDRVRLGEIGAGLLKLPNNGEVSVHGWSRTGAEPNDHCCDDQRK